MNVNYLQMVAYAAFVLFVLYMAFSPEIRRFWRRRRCKHIRTHAFARERGWWCLDCGHEWRPK